MTKDRPLTPLNNFIDILLLRRKFELNLNFTLDFIILFYYAHFLININNNYAYLILRPFYTIFKDTLTLYSCAYWELPELDHKGKLRS